MGTYTGIGHTGYPTLARWRREAEAEKTPTTSAYNHDRQGNEPAVVKVAKQ